MPTFDMFQKQQILNKSGGICAHCGIKLNLKEFTIDHYIPKSRGGSNEIVNLIPLCEHCNLDKSNKLLEPREAYPYINIMYEIQLEDLYYRYLVKKQKRGKSRKRKNLAENIDDKLIQEKSELNKIRHSGVDLYKTENK